MEKILFPHSKSSQPGKHIPTALHLSPRQAWFPQWRKQRRGGSLGGRAVLGVVREHSWVLKVD